MNARNIVDTGDTTADILSPDTYTQGVPHAAFEKLRDDDPVHWHEDKDGGLWSITRYDDVLSANSNPEIFSSAKGIRIENMDADELEARKTMMEMDRPEHTTYRRLVQPPFLPRNVNGYDDMLRELALSVINDARQHTEFDFVTEIARQLPMRMLGKLLGVPDEDGPWLVEMGDALIGNTDPEFTDVPVGLVDTDEYRLMPFRSPHSFKLFEYAAAQATDRRANPKSDLITRLLEPTRKGDVLNDNDFNNFFTLLVAAGNDTTRYTMAAGMHALISYPDQMQKLIDNPELIDSATEEILRWGTVTMHFRRTAKEDYEMHGKTIKAGDRVVLWFISADYDSRQYDNPYTFDITRDPNPHMAFGLKSPHKCIGEHLARLEIKVLFRELLPLMKSVELNGDVDRLRSNFISGIKHLPIKVEWA
ncbi:MAG: cytochrome P450 [Chloroflexota bacterium]